MTLCLSALVGVIIELDRCALVRAKLWWYFLPRLYEGVVVIDKSIYKLTVQKQGVERRSPSVGVRVEMLL